ncbi:MAG TPA: hypothetical protein PKM34_09500 [Bacteroidales bacterium]|nr:hypothetical protein [Bacteroidales bacterium]
MSSRSGNNRVVFVALTTILLITAFTACKDPDKDKTPEYGKLTLYFAHLFHDNWLVIDDSTYVNAAGNELIFNELQYFISDVVLHYSDGSEVPVNQWKEIHYVDSDIPETMTWEIFDSLPPGAIDSISFVFGISEEKNQSYMYVNPPESLMFWPDILGGGYHYLKLNGKWKNEENQLSPFNFHLGIGQVYDTAGHITGFIQNYFRTGARLPVYSSYALVVEPGETTSVTLAMDVASWFETPDIWDFNYWGGDIMQNQEALHAGCRNGFDIFSLMSPLFINE